MSSFNSLHSSDNGFFPEFWGRQLWIFLHTMSLNYPMKPSKAQMKDYDNFIKSLHGILPCGKCRDGFRQSLAEMDYERQNFKDFLISRENFVKFIFQIHNKVNKRLGARIFTEDDLCLFLKDLERARADCTKTFDPTKTHQGCSASLGERKPRVQSIILMVPSGTGPAFRVHKGCDTCPI